MFVLVSFELGEFLEEDSADILADFEAFFGESLPPCPSKTAKRELLSPMLSSWMAASSMVFRQPAYGQLYPAFLLRRS
jgi:hypothetical protein